MSEHTKEPWIVGECFIGPPPVPPAPMNAVCRWFPEDLNGDANAHRIVACVNACEGIEAPETTIPELLAACKKLADE